MPTNPENSSSSSSRENPDEEKKPRKPPGPFNQAKLDELERTRDIIIAYRLMNPKSFPFYRLTTFSLNYQVSVA